MSLKVLQPSELTDKVGVVLGTRPGIIKMAPIIRKLQEREASFFTLHTGQHYSESMDGTFFVDLDLPNPEHRLEEPAGSQLHGEQTAAMLVGSERVFLEERPRVVLVGGDANTSLAAALAARKLHIAVGHVESGLRSYDWRMPEEHNRVIIDHIADVLFAPSDNAKGNLEREGVRGRIEVVGNTIVESVRQGRDLAMARSTILDDLDLVDDQYLLMTLHREENVDDPDQLSLMMDVLETLPERFGLPVVLPAHPRTRRRLEEFGLLARASRIEGLRVAPAVGYLDFLRLLQSARLLLTDSGGAQQEACIVGVPTVVLRDVTEWVEGVQVGAIFVGGSRPDTIDGAIEEALLASRDWMNPFGDGTTSDQIVDVVSSWDSRVPALVG